MKAGRLFPGEGFEYEYHSEKLCRGAERKPTKKITHNTSALWRY